MGKKPQRHTWPEAKKLCRLNQNDIAMAKRLGFGPDGLIRARPDPEQKWKLPVKYWVRELHSERFGYVIGEKPLPAPAPEKLEYDADAARAYGEQVYWEEYEERNADDPPVRKTRASGSGEVPVNEWVRSLHQEKFGSRKPGSAVPPGGNASVAQEQNEERRNAEDPWPDRPEIADLPPLDLDAEFPGDEFGFDRYEPPDEDDIDEQNGLLLRRQRLLRWAAEAIAVAWSRLPEVEKVAAFGAVSQPLEMEVPRFPQFRRHRIEVLHECADLDLAVWLTDLGRLRDLKNAMARGLELTHDTAYGGVAHHQVDVHVFEYASGAYRGRLCIFGQCPKPGKRECHVPGCGSQPFLQQFARYHFNPALFSAGLKVILFDRAAGFLVPLPRIDAKPREVRWTPREPGDTDITDDDVPF
jgi:hypothetical protein